MIRTWLIILILAQSAVTVSAQNGVITGRVLSPSGAPVAGERVAAMTTGDSNADASLMSIAQTDAEGRYVLEGVPRGRYYIAAGSIEMPAYFPGVWDHAQATVVTVTAGARQENIDFQIPVVPETVKVQGRVLRSGSETPGAADVEVQFRGRSTFTTMTDQDGHFEFTVRALDVYVASAATAAESRVVFVGAAGVSALVLRSAPGVRVSGHVIREDASRFAGSPRLRFTNSRGSIVTVIAADGSFGLSDVPRGTYTVEVESSVAPRLTVTVRDADLPDLRLEIPHGIRVAGEVIREDMDVSRPPGGQIQLIGAAIGRAALAADGTFEFSDVVPGKYRVEIIPAAIVRWPALELVAAGQDITGLRWTVPDPRKVDLRPLLESERPVDQAWGGWIAGEGERTELAPVLEKALIARLSKSSAGGVDELAIDTISDALIRFDTRLPLSTVQALYAVRPDSALLLLSRMDSSADGFLLELIENQHELPWFASANLLLERRSAGFAAALVKGLRLEAHVIICNPGISCDGPHRVTGIGVGDGQGQPMINLPPWPKYTLFRGLCGPLPRKEYAPVPAGPVPVSVARKVWVDLSPDPTAQHETPSPPSSEDRLTYIRAFAPEARVALKDHEDLVVEWHGQAALDAGVERFRQDILSRYHNMIQDLLVGGAISSGDAEALANPHLSLVVDNPHSGQ
ncbi:MAG TPA: carboxypeptidase-like regulatory domain-containing protein [Terriglobia bacterium]|nr:carboxypeptidase-like regulatory domain-containing protein [Terriglobia bacterium]